MFFFFFFVFCTKHILSQESIVDCVHCIDSHFKEIHTSISNYVNQNLRPRSGTECDKKYIKCNVYYIQDSNGLNNFSATGDGLGYGYNGRQFAEDLFRYMNNKYNNNSKMNIPPSNNISVLPKDIQFIIEGIYYIKNQRLNRYTDTIPGWRTVGDPRLGYTWTFDNADFNSYAVNKDSCLHFFIQGRGNVVKSGNPQNIFVNALSRSGGGGSGVSFGPYFLCESWARYYSYRNSIQNTDYLDWVMDGEGSLWEHEAAHCLGLYHTVMDAFGARCPTIKFGGFVDNSCDDGINDTRTAWYMTDVINGPIHPAERDGGLRSLYPNWWSNNLLDYGGNGSLTPKQIDFVHRYLTQQYPGWLVENAQKINRNFCSWVNNKIAYYGKLVSINKNCSSTLSVLSNLPKRIYYTQAVEIYNGFEVQNGGEFEVIQSCAK